MLLQLLAPASSPQRDRPDECHVVIQKSRSDRDGGLGTDAVYPFGIGRDSSRRPAYLWVYPFGVNLPASTGRAKPGNCRCIKSGGGTPR